MYAENSTISNNAVKNSGGGIATYEDSETRLYYSTVAGNLADSDWDGNGA